MQTGCIRLFSAGVVALALFASAAVAAPRVQGSTSHRTPTSDPQDLDGVWRPVSAEPSFQPSDGKPIPFTAAGRAQWMRNVADAKAGKPDPQLECTPPGVPRLMAEPNPIQIISGPGQINFFHEYQHDQRLIYIDSSPAADPDPTYLGHSTGRWDGPTLVVDTIAFNDKTRIDPVIPHSDRLHVVERFKKLNSGRALEDLITIEDPVIFSRPWTTRRVYAWRPELRMREIVCEEKLFGGKDPRAGKAAE